MSATGATASHAAAATNGQQQPAREGPSCTPTTDGPQLLSHSGASTPGQPASLSSDLSTAAQTHADAQTDSAAAPVPVTLLPVLPTTLQQSLSKSPSAAPTAATPAAVAAPPTGALTPDIVQAHASEQTLSSQPAGDSTLSGQQQTSKEYRSSVSAIDDLSELELDADIATGVSAMVEAVPQRPALAASQSASQKRPACQAPLDLTSPTIPSAKKPKMGNSSTSAATADRTSAQLARSAQQLAGSPRTTTQVASRHCQVVPAATPSSEAFPSMHTTAGIPPHEHSQTAVAVPTILTETVETDASSNAMALPQHPHTAASKADSVLFEAPQRLVLSIPVSNTRPSATAACATFSCQLPAAALSSAAAHQLLGTAATASTAPATTTSRPSVALLSRSLVTLHPNPTLPSDLSASSKLAPSSYQPVIEELPPDFTPTAPNIITAAAKKLLPSKPAMVIDIDSDDDHILAANNQPAVSLQDDKLAQSHDSIARLSSKPAMPRYHATEAKTAVERQVSPGLHPTPTAATTPVHAIKQATAIQTSFNQPAAPMGMGHIFSSFSAFEDLSDAEEEDAGRESAAAASRPAGQLQHAGGYTCEGYAVAT